MNFQRILCLFLMIALFSCREDFEQNIAIPQTFNPELLGDYEGEVELVNGSVKGIVLDQQDNPITNAQVELNDNQTNTDEYGHFFFTNVPMNAQGTVVNVKVKDFQLGSKLFYPQADATENIEITLNRIESDDELSGLSAGDVTISGGITFTYPENAFLNKDGSLYDGSIFIRSTFTNESDDNFFKIIPGNFQAVDINNELVGLKAAQLLQITILDEDGLPLKINKETPVSLILPQDITEGMEAWYYSETEGLYTINTEREDQTINYKNSTSLLIAEAANTSGQLLTLKAADDTTLLENMEVQVLSNTQEVLFKGFSNDQGQVRFNKSTDETSRLGIVDACGQLVHNEDLVTNNTDMKLDQVSTKVVTGEVYTCEVNPSMQNVIRILQGNRMHYFYEDDSEFALTLQTCADGVAIIAALENSNDIANAESIDLDDVVSAIDLFTCEDPAINELRIFNLDTNEEYVYPITSTIGSTDQITSFTHYMQEGQEFKISFNGSVAGNYSAAPDHEIERIYDDAESLRLSGDADVFEVSRFGDMDNITIGSFEGTFENSTTTENINLRGSFNFYFQP